MGNSQSTELQLAVMGNILLQRSIPHTDRQFWDRLLSIGVNAADIFDNFTLDFLRNLRDKRQQNFATLVKLLCIELHAAVWRNKQTVQMVTAASLTSPHAKAATTAATATSMASGAAAAAPAGGHALAAMEGLGERKQLVLNCVRLLTRVMAVVNEAPGDAMRGWMQGGVLQGMLEVHEEERRKRASMRAKKERERKHEEEMMRKAREVAGEREKEEAIRRDEEKQLLQAKVEREAKEATQSADAAQAKARDARKTAAEPDGSVASATEGGARRDSSITSPFDTTPGSATPADAGRAEADFAEEEDAGGNAAPVKSSDDEKLADAASASSDVAKVDDSKAKEARKEDNAPHKEEVKAADEANPDVGANGGGTATAVAADESESNFAFITAAVANQTSATAAEMSHSEQKEEATSSAGNDAVEPAADTVTATTVTTDAESSPTAADLSVPSTLSSSSSHPAPVTDATVTPRRSKARVDPPLDEWWTGQLFGSPLSFIVVNVLIDLAFLPSFSVSSKPTPVVLRHDLDMGKCWAVGVGFPPKISVPALAYAGAEHNVGEEWELDTQRVEVLRCMLASCCAPMFCRRLEDSNGDAFIRGLVSGQHPLTTTLAFSLLNLVLGWRPETVLPYSYAISTDYRQPLVEICAQLLMILLDRQVEMKERSGHEIEGREERRTRREKNGSDEKEREDDGEQNVIEQNGKADVDSSHPEGVKRRLSASSPSASTSAPHQRPPAVVIPDDNNSISSSAVTTQLLSSPSQQQEAERLRALPSAPHHNIFAERLFSLSPPEMSYVYKSICRLLHHGMMSSWTYLPGSASGLTIEAELFVLLWKWFDQCDAFLPHVLDQCDVLALVTPLLYYTYESRKDSSKLGLMYTCVFILLKLSGEREFSVELNKTIPAASLAHIPLLSLLALTELTADCNYADALIVIAHRLITTSPHHLDALLKVLLTLLANISPYITRLSAVAATRLVALFELFAQPSFVYTNSNNHQYCLLLLDAFNNAIQYQWSGSSQLVLAIVRRARVFYSLRPVQRGEGYANAMTGVGSKGHAIVFQRQMALQGMSSSPTAAQLDVASAADSASAAVAVHPITVMQQQSPSASGLLPLPSSAFSSPVQSLLAAPSPTSLPSPSLSQYASESFTPTEQWAAGWKSRLPLETVYRLFDFLLPKVEQMARQSTHPLTDHQVLSFIQSQTLVGILPLPHAIVVRRYIRNAFTNNWFSVYLWGLVFLRQQQPKLFDGRRVKLFAITGKGVGGGRGEEAGGREDGRDGRQGSETVTGAGEVSGSGGVAAEPDVSSRTSTGGEGRGARADNRVGTGA